MTSISSFNIVLTRYDECFIYSINILELIIHFHSHIQYHYNQTICLSDITYSIIIKLFFFITYISTRLDKGTIYIQSFKNAAFTHFTTTSQLKMVLGYSAKISRKEQRDFTQNGEFDLYTSVVYNFYL